MPLKDINLYIYIYIYVLKVYLKVLKLFDVVFIHLLCDDLKKKYLLTCELISNMVVIQWNAKQ